MLQFQFDTEEKRFGTDGQIVILSEKRKIGEVGQDGTLLVCADGCM